MAFLTLIREFNQGLTAMQLFQMFAGTADIWEKLPNGYAIYIIYVIYVLSPKLFLSIIIRILCISIYNPCWIKMCSPFIYLLEIIIYTKNICLAWYLVHVCGLVAHSCPTLCDPMDCSPPGSSVHDILQARVLEWIAISFSRGSSLPRDQTRVSHLVDRRFTVWATREVQLFAQVVKLHVCSVSQSPPTLCDLMDCSRPISSAHGLLQARILEWIAISSRRDLPNLGIESAPPALAGRFVTNEPPEKPVFKLPFGKVAAICIHTSNRYECPFPINAHRYIFWSTWYVMQYFW